jgi:hypothetical protein
MTPAVLAKVFTARFRFDEPEPVSSTAMPRRDVEDTCWFVIIEEGNNAFGVNAFADASNATRKNSFAAMVKGWAKKDEQKGQG